MPFDREIPRHPNDLYDYMERFCRRSDLVSNQPKGISHLSKADQLAHCLAESHKGLERFPGFRKGGA